MRFPRLFTSRLGLAPLDATEWPARGYGSPPLARPGPPVPRAIGHSFRIQEPHHPDHAYETSTQLAAHRGEDRPGRGHRQPAAGRPGGDGGRSADPLLRRPLARRTVPGRTGDHAYEHHRTDLPRTRVAGDPARPGRRHRAAHRERRKAVGELPVVELLHGHAARPAPAQGRSDHGGRAVGEGEPARDGSVPVADPDPRHPVRVLHDAAQRPGCGLRRVLEVDRERAEGRRGADDVCRCGRRSGGADRAGRGLRLPGEPRALRAPRRQSAQGSDPDRAPGHGQDAARTCRRRGGPGQLLLPVGFGVRRVARRRGRGARS